MALPMMMSMVLDFAISARSSWVEGSATPNLPSSMCLAYCQGHPDISVWFTSKAAMCLPGSLHCLHKAASQAGYCPRLATVQGEDANTC